MIYLTVLKRRGGGDQPHVWILLSPVTGTVYFTVAYFATYAAMMIYQYYATVCQQIFNGTTPSSSSILTALMGRD
jgi:hypothetical protein